MVSLARRTRLCAYKERSYTDTGVVLGHTEQILNNYLLTVVNEWMKLNP